MVYFNKRNFFSISCFIFIVSFFIISFLFIIFFNIIYFFVVISTLNFLIYLFKIFLVFFAFLSIVLITPLAIKETTIRGIFGYSSIIQTSFLLLGVQLNTKMAISSVLF